MPGQLVTLCKSDDMPPWMFFYVRVVSSTLPFRLGRWIRAIPTKSSRGDQTTDRALEEVGQADGHLINCPARDVVR